MKNKNYKKTRFKSLIRIAPKQLEYIRDIRAGYTLAGRLDEMINFYRKHKKKSLDS